MARSCFCAAAAPSLESAAAVEEEKLGDWRDRVPLVAEGVAQTVRSGRGSDVAVTVGRSDVCGAAVGGALGARPDQAGASRCWWSFNRLWVAVRSRHSDLTADLPRRKKRFARRFDLICPKTGSTVPCRLR